MTMIDHPDRTPPPGPGARGWVSIPAFEIPAWLPEKWQSIVDTVADLADVPAGLVMRVVGDDIEVFVSSRTIGNPYKPGEALRLPDSGLYCEQVIRSNGMLIVPDARIDDAWKDNPDIELDMVSYLGVPILWPDALPFGTLCILDNKERCHSALIEKLLAQFRDMIEHHLSLIYNDTRRERAFAADRQRHDEALQSSEQRFRLLVEHAVEDFILHDEHGRILDANNQASRNSGRTLEQLRQAAITDLPIQFGDAWNRAVWSQARPGDTATIEAAYRLPNGQVASVEIRWSCQLMHGEKLFLILSRDVSERQRAEEAMRVAEAELARAARLTMMGQLAGSIIHEINQPLTAIRTCARACLRWLDHDVPQIAQAQEAARLLSRAVQDASEIVAGLRSVAQKTASTKAAVDINTIVEDALLLTRRDCAKAGIRRHVAIAAVPMIVMGDRTQLKQIVLNLLLNACDAMREVADGDHALAVTTGRSGDGQVVVSVEDTGTGLKGQPQDRLFEPLFTTKDTGMGMGLAICKSIALAHAGTIRAEDRSDRRGARFVLALPAVLADNQAFLPIAP
jgi:PAS domain S-box-containing protein